MSDIEYEEIPGLAQYLPDYGKSVWHKAKIKPANSIKGNK